MNPVSSPLPSFAGLRPRIPQPLFVKQWLGVVNNLAGKFQGPKLRDELEPRVGTMVDFYATVADPKQRITDIITRIHQFDPSPETPLGILAVGGDGTFHDVVKATLGSIFYSPTDLIEYSPKAVAMRMEQSGIRLGIVGIGSANDGQSLAGAPGYNINKILTYLGEPNPKNLNPEPLLAPMSLGLVRFFGLDGELQQDEIFCHSVNAGPTIAKTFEMTENERGKAALRKRERLTFKHTIRPKPMHIAWRRGDASGAMDSMEVLFRAVVRISQFAGFPGHPPVGLGTTIFPNSGILGIANIFRQTTWRGLSSQFGNPRFLMPHQSLSSLTPEQQPALAVGDTMEIGFHQMDRQPTEMPVTVDGDHAGYAHRLEIHALPPFPNLLISKNSLMDRRLSLLADKQE